MFLQHPRNLANFNKYLTAILLHTFILLIESFGETIRKLNFCSIVMAHKIMKDA